MYKNLENGRSMIEMLGVLAIIGVLSVGGIAGYGKAMEKFKVNKIVEDYKTSGKMFMYMNLAGTVAREINDMTLEVEFPKGMNEVAKDFLARPDIKQNLRETIHLACGKEMQIKFVDTKEISKTNSNEFEQFIERNNIPFNII